MTPSRHPEEVALQHVGLDPQEVELLQSLCNSQPALLAPFAFNPAQDNGSPHVLLMDADQPDALEKLQHCRARKPQHLVLVTSRNKQHRFYPTLKRPLSFANLRDTLLPLAQADQAHQATG